MIPHLITEPEVRALSWEDDIKGHLRLDSDEEKARIEDGLVGSATRWAEGLTNRQLITATWEFWYANFAEACAAARRHPCTYPLDTILIPRPPLQSVTHIKYYDTANVLQTWSPSSYTVVVPVGPEAGRGWIRPVPSAIFPVTYARPDAVQIRVVCGYGDASSDVPAGIRHGMLVYVAELYERREVSVVGTIVADAPLSAVHLAGGYLVEV